MAVSSNGSLERREDVVVKYVTLSEILDGFYVAERGGSSLLVDDPLYICTQVHFLGKHVALILIYHLVGMVVVLGKYC